MHKFGFPSTPGLTAGVGFRGCAVTSVASLQSGLADPAAVRPHVPGSCRFKYSRSQLLMSKVMAHVPLRPVPLLCYLGLLRAPLWPLHANPGGEKGAAAT